MNAVPTNVAASATIDDGDAVSSHHSEDDEDQGYTYAEILQMAIGCDHITMPLEDAIRQSIAFLDTERSRCEVIGLFKALSWGYDIPIDGDLAKLRRAYLDKVPHW